MKHCRAFIMSGTISRLSDWVMCTLYHLSPPYLTFHVAQFLVGKLIEARRQIEAKSKHFAGLTTSMGDERTNTWNTMGTEPVVVDGDVVSVYKLKDVKGARIYSAIQPSSMSYQYLQWTPSRRDSACPFPTSRPQARTSNPLSL